MSCVVLRAVRVVAVAVVLALIAVSVPAMPEPAAAQTPDVEINTEAVGGAPPAGEIAELRPADDGACEATR